MSLINFMSKKYIKKLSVDKPERENFGIENLLTNQEGKLNFYSRNSQNTGFVADTFIRPPINIRIDLNQPISLQSIILYAKVNKQISNGFVISTSTRYSVDTEFKQICKLINHKHNECHQYKLTRRKQHEADLMESKPDLSTFNVGFFSANPQTFLNEVTSINVSIVWTLNSSQPCLKSVQILGFLTDGGSSGAMQIVRLPEIEFIDEKAGSVVLPAEFLDDLTHELMKMPMRLPSGKTVDKTTLDKYSKELKQNKKPDQDPFTCLPFTSNYKPYIDEKLKSQIDKFFLENQGKKFEYEKELTTQGVKRSAGDLPVFQPKRTRPNLRSIEKELSCNCCLNVKSGSRSLYEVTGCRHHFCRECLTVLDKVCSVCQKGFNNSQVVNINRIDMAKK